MWLTETIYYHCLCFNVRGGATRNSITPFLLIYYIFRCSYFINMAIFVFKKMCVIITLNFIWLLFCLKKLCVIHVLCGYFCLEKTVLIKFLGKWMVASSKQYFTVLTMYQYVEKFMYFLGDLTQFSVL